MKILKQCLAMADNPFNVHLPQPLPLLWDQLWRHKEGLSGTTSVSLALVPACSEWFSGFDLGQSDSHSQKTETEMSEDREPESSSTWIPSQENSHGKGKIRSSAEVSRAGLCLPFLFFVCHLGIYHSCPAPWIFMHPLLLVPPVRLSQKEVKVLLNKH